MLIERLFYTAVYIFFVNCIADKVLVCSKSSNFKCCIARKPIALLMERDSPRTDTDNNRKHVYWIHSNGN